MRRSFVRLAVNSVLACWIVGFVVLYAYVIPHEWTEERARKDGVFLVYALLDEVPPAARAERLQALRPHVGRDLNLVTVQVVERRLGREAMPGSRLWYKESERREWYFVVFSDGQGALAAGPVNPAIPRGVWPIGVILAVVGLPVIAGLLSLRVGQELSKVERASRALAVGELGARVENSRGPSNELAAAFNAMADRIEHLIRSRDELVQAVSHELGSPLSRLRFHVALLETPSEAPQLEERLRAMTRELDALDELVAELLTYVQTDELKIERTIFSPQRSLADLAELATLEASEQTANRVEVELPDGVLLNADQRLFQRAVENILRNAVQHARGRIALALAEDADSVRVAVHDDGPGIPAELRDKVMVPFYRLQPDRARKTGGVGLGLAIVSRILERHGGRIEIGRSPLGGAVVETIWPKAV